MNRIDFESFDDKVSLSDLMPQIAAKVASYPTAGERAAAAGEAALCFLRDSHREGFPVSVLDFVTFMHAALSQMVGILGIVKTCATMEQLGLIAKENAMVFLTDYGHSVVADITGENDPGNEQPDWN